MRVVLLALVAGLAGCETSPAPSSQVPSSQAAGQKWICGTEYVNHAWGYQRRGLVIDAEGKVLRHEVRPDGEAPAGRWMPADTARITGQELAPRYLGGRDTGRTVSASEIAEHLPLIAEAARTKATEPKMTAADMGAWTTYCLLHDATTGTYAQVMLDSRGDMTSSNPSPAARKLSAWVNRVTGPLDKP